MIHLWMVVLAYWSVHISVVSSRKTYDEVSKKPVASVQCSLLSRDVVFRRNVTTGEYYVATATKIEDEAVMPSVDDSTFRECWCTTLLSRKAEFCPSHFHSCTVRGDTGPVRCIRSSGSTNLLRAVWPGVLFWFSCLLCAVVCTTAGRSCVHFVQRQIFGGKNSRSAEQDSQDGDDPILNANLTSILSRHPQRAAQMYRSAIHREYLVSRNFDQARHRNGYVRLWGRIWTARVLLSYNGYGRDRGDSRDNEYTSHSVKELCYTPVLLLKTKRFVSDPEEEGDNTQSSSWISTKFRRDQATLDEMDEQMEKGNRCAICLERLREGEVIGDIACGHMLHKDCLKTWLSRHNRCPLCQHIDIAISGFRMLPRPRITTEIVGPNELHRMVAAEVATHSQDVIANDT
jgi:hypothetical protein